LSLLSVVKDVAAVVGVANPAAVASVVNTDRTMFEMLALANEIAERIAANTRDWTLLRKSATCTGGTVGVLDPEGKSEAYALPGDYWRMLTESQVWRSISTIQPMRFIPSTDEWVQRRAANYCDPRGEWTIYGGNIHFAPVLTAAIGAVAAMTVRFSYLQKNTINLSSGGVGDHFVADADTYRLPERLLRLGMIWQWCANKGSPYAEALATYEDAMGRAMGSDSPAPILVDRMPISAATNIAYPYPLPTP
jgi:hypothetical protein